MVSQVSTSIAPGGLRAPVATAKAMPLASGKTNAGAPAQSAANPTVAAQPTGSIRRFFHSAGMRLFYALDDVMLPLFRQLMETCRF